MLSADTSMRTVSILSANYLHKNIYGSPGETHHKASLDNYHME